MSRKWVQKHWVKVSALSMFSPFFHYAKVWYYREQMLRNSCLFTTSPTFFSPLTPNCIFPLMNSLPPWTSIRTLPHSSPMPHSLRWNSILFLDALLCFTLLVSDPFCSSTSPSVYWFPFSSHMLSSLESTVVPHPLCSPSSSFCFPFRLSVLQSLVNTLSYNSLCFFYDFLFPFLLGLCTSCTSI